ncbi:MAG: monovalent cation/H+ antiporter subunit A [Pseudomonadota bacterium]
MTLLTLVVLPLVLGSGLCAWLGRRSRIGAAGVALAVALVVVALLAQAAPAVLSGAVQTFAAPWLPDVGLQISLRLDGLSWMFALLISGMGALVVVYAHFYLAPQDSAARLYGLLMVFMAAMLGVVLSDNLLLLVVFWELTSLSSFLLVGYWSHRPEARAGARQALAVTGGGGLAMLAGFVLLGQIAGTFEISEMMGRAAEIQSDPAFVPALLLILLGAFTKSAQFPFHFWLPDAMAAPTPVSAFLHSATMVKAGVFLLMRLQPVLAGSGWFEALVSGAGLITLSFAAGVALFKHDLKGLLAYSTVSHLGLIMFLVGLASPMAAVVAVFHVLNHASFKAPLFMVAGIVDHETHTRDMRRLGGLWQAMPWTGTIAIVAAAGMAGVPLTNGFLSKEMYFTEAVAHFAGAGALAWAVPLVVTLAGALSVAYSLRLVHDTFFHGPARDLPQAHPHDPPLGMRAPAALLALVCLAVGVLPGLLLGPVVDVAARAMTQQALPPYHLALWHGVNLPLGMSVLALLGGVALYARLAAGRRLHGIDSEAWFGRWSGRALFERALDAVLRLSGRVTATLENGSLQRYLAWLIGAALAVGAATLAGQGVAAGARALLPAGPLALGLWGLLCAICLVLVWRHHDRLLAVILTGGVGLITALAFALLSAPDLALTQLSVEVVSTVMLLMGLALLPPHSPRESSPGRRWRDAALAVLAGSGMAALAWWVLTRDHDSIAWYFLERAVPQGGGSNVVNVILVDFRGYDTFGEITVLGIAAIGVYALMQGMRTTRPPVDAGGRRWTFAQPPLLLRVAASVVLPMALVYALYIFLRGHNLPGGGFIAGLITAVALVLQYVALGQQRAEALLRAAGGQRFVRWIGAGLGIAGLTGVGAFAWGRPFLTSAHGYLALPVVGELPLATAALFDLGVYLTVVGSTLLTLSVLAQVSREDAAAGARVGGAGC